MVIEKWNMANAVSVNNQEGIYMRYMLIYLLENYRAEALIPVDRRQDSLLVSLNGSYWR